MKRLGWSSSVLQVVAAAIVITACGSIGGRPSVFADTTAYVRQGEYLATQLHLAGPLADAPGVETPAALSRAAIARVGPDFTAMAGARSPFYGFPLFVLAGIGSIWLVAFVQALVAAWLLRVTASTALPESNDAAFWTTLVVLGVGSSLPFFVDFAMPDVFAGFALIAVALLLTASDRLRGRDRFGLWVTMTTAMLFHRSIDATVLCLTPLGLVGLARRGASTSTLMARGAVIAGGAAVAVLAAGALQLAYHRDTGYFMGTPPFVAARLLVDGPGKSYLASSCPGGAAPTFCRYENASMNSEDDVLWRKQGGVFGSASYGDRVAMEKEELAFVAASIRFAPALAFTSAVRNWAEQLALMFVDDPLGDPAIFLAHAGADVPAIQHLYPGLTPCRVRGGCRAVSILMREQIILAVEAPVLLVSLLVVGFVGVAVLRRPLAQRGTADDDQLRMVMSTARLVLYGIVLNAAVCGILSGPFPRYQARVIWLVPMIAVLSLMALRRYGGARSASEIAAGMPHAASVFADANRWPSPKAS